MDSIGGRMRIALATENDRKTIYRMRHDVYATELGQHGERPEGELQDPLDAHNLYIVAWIRGYIAGFVSITPPGGAYSMDKYVARADLPFPFDDGLYEVRLLTVDQRFRGSNAAAMLSYSAMRWAEAHGATRVMAIGRQDIMRLYHRLGFRSWGLCVQSGAVPFEVMTAARTEWQQVWAGLAGVVDRLEAGVQWELPLPFRSPSPCFHGGAFFEAVGDTFGTLEKSAEIVNADVLDAWFPPSPKVLQALQEHLPWLARTSPPAGAEGLVQTIARVRGVPAAAILPGAGSSSLIFMALRHWLTPASRVLIMDPTYGEYAHVLEHVIGCRVHRLPLARQNGYDVDLDRLAREAPLYNLVVLVNPNSPTGRHIPREALETALRGVPDTTRVWVDETYVEHAGAGQSLEAFAVTRPNVVVCKSMSKVYALSGLRVGYLCAAPPMLEELRAITPPWSVGLPAQVAAVRALEDPEYYTARYTETASLREGLAHRLAALGLEPVPGIANFLLCRLPDAGPDAATVVQRCRERGVFLRDAGAMGKTMGTRMLRVAVKDGPANERIIAALAAALGRNGP